MKKIILLPIIIAITSKIYAGKLTTILTLGLLASAGVMGDVSNTHSGLSQSFGGVAPYQQMSYIATLQKGCLDRDAFLVETSIDKTTQSAAATCKWEQVGTDEHVASMVTRSLPQDHTIQSFCDGDSRGVKVMFKHKDQSVALYFKTDGTLEKADIINENVAKYRKGFSISYIVAKAQSAWRTCFSGKSDTLSAVTEAEVDSAENQKALGIMYNADSEWGYTSHKDALTSAENTSDKMLKDILSKATRGAITEHSKTIGDGVVLTTTYKSGTLVNYSLFMRNADGSTEVVGLNPDLSTQTAFPLRQKFDKFAENVGEESVVTTSGTGNKRQTKRIDLLSKPRPKKTQCLIKQEKVDGKVVGETREGDCQ